MKTKSLFSQRGGAFITVLGFSVILLMLIGSVLKYSGSERRLNNRSKLHFETRLAAEAISEYGIAQVKNILEKNSTFTDSTWSSESLFVPGGTFAGGIYTPPDTFWGGGHIVPSTGATAEQPVMHVGKILDVSAGGLVYIDPTIPDNDTDPLKGKRVFKYSLDILSRATARDSTGSHITNYMQQSFSIRAAPLFSNAIYYNMDLELQPGPNFTVTGSTHANGRMFIRSASASPTYIRFAGPVTAVKGFWTHFHRQTADTNTNTAMPFFQNYNEQGELQDNVVRNSSNPGPIEILVAGTSNFKPMRLAAATTGYSPNLANGAWVESTWNLVPASETWRQHLGLAASGNTETAATREKYANWTQQTFRGNLMTHVNGLTPMTLPGIPDYVYVYGSAYPDTTGGTTDAAYTYTTNASGTPTGNDNNNAAHALIESPRLSSASSYNEATEKIKYSRNAGLYIVANTTSTDVTNGHMPDGTAIRVKAQSYRAFLNDTSTTPVTITEVLLPGQNTYGDNNSLSNPFVSSGSTMGHKDARPVVTLFDTYYDGTTPNWFTEKSTARRMYDLRRFGNYEPPKDPNNATGRGTGTNTTYDPKNLYMIDIDVTELKKAVKSINVNIGSTATNNTEFYATGLPPTVSADFNKYIYNASATPTFSVTIGDTNQIIVAPPNPASPGTMQKAYTAAKWNGAVYVESIAADRFNTAGATQAARHRETRKLRDSGVRLVNGRGKVPSINTTQGFSLITNDAVYVLGSYNCDGIESTPSTTAFEQLTPLTPGASTGHYPDDGTDVPNSAELPASIVADAVTLLSQPVYSSATVQTNGWNDALSYNRSKDNNWVSTWATTSASSTNRRDGVDTLRTLYKVPYDSNSGSLSTTSTFKLSPDFSEYSTALLMGLVPTGKDGIRQTSGSLNNFPRFLEDWNNAKCRIRGAFVALFECRVATEPWNIKVYGAPTRNWGFNLIFNEGRMPPLTPKTLSFRRSGAVDIRKNVYNSKLDDWGYTQIP